MVVVGFLHDERGSGEYVVVVVVISVLIFLLVFGVNSAELLLKRSHMEAVLRESLFQMERQGGLTADMEAGIRLALSRRGFNPEGIQIEGTPTGAGYGEPVRLTITYVYQARSPVLDGGLLIGGMRDEARRIVVQGASSSRRLGE